MAHLAEVLDNLKSKKGYFDSKEALSKSVKSTLKKKPEELKLPSSGSILGKRKAAPPA